MGSLSFLVLLFLYFRVVIARNDCLPSFCRSRTIRFPFRLPDQPEDCGYPGFDLNCNVTGLPLVLNLSYTESHFVSFSILEIDYDIQRIELYDPNSCNRFMKLNLSSSPFKVVSYGNHSLFNCLVYMLEWDSPNCRICEAKKVGCEFKDSMISKQIQCYKDPSNEKTRIRTIITAIIVPIISCTACLFCYKSIMRNAARNSLENNNAASQTTTSTGLDHSTIESYATVILGESKRIAGPNGDTCPICLADYLPKDLLRCIPECQHCFHVECIDEWLRLKSNCPVCRNSPQNVKMDNCVSVMQIGIN